MPGEPKRKNNHFVPQSYLKRFKSVSEMQVGLFNLKSGLIVETAPIKSQCSRDYFYTKNPVFEQMFGDLEGQHKRLVTRILEEDYVPGPLSNDHHSLLSMIMFQAGRTEAVVAHQDHLADEFGRAIMRKHFEKERKHDLLAYLDKVRITMPDAILDAIAQHLSMYPLISDLDVSLFVNRTAEDFLTSDHPVARCNNLPATAAPYGANIGFASRGLLILMPLSPRSLLLLSDPEVYNVTKRSDNVVPLTKVDDVVGLNLAQCFEATQNLYFASGARVQSTLAAFRKRSASLRKGVPPLTETPTVMPDGRTGVLFSMVPHNHRMALPKAIALRRAALTGKYRCGDGLRRDPVRVALVSAELDRLKSRQEEAIRKAEANAKSSC